MVAQRWSELLSSSRVVFQRVSFSWAHVQVAVTELSGVHVQVSSALAEWIWSDYLQGTVSHSQVLWLVGRSDSGYLSVGRSILDH